MIRVTKIPAECPIRFVQMSIPRVSLINLPPEYIYIGIYCVLWVVIKRETADQRRERRRGRGEKVGARGRKKNGEGNNIKRGGRRVEEEEGIRCANSMRLVQCESSRGKLARGCCSRFPDLTTLNKLPMQI